MVLLERIKRAFANEKVEYWEARPENFSRAELERVIDSSPVLSDQRKEPRVSNNGVHGLDGEDDVYSAKLTVSSYGVTVMFYVKCFFWTKNDKQPDQGIEVQSFKAWE